MKQKIIFTTVIVLTLSSQFITAGSITDSYTTGDTLTAKKMTEIKDAINDNDTRSIANEGEIFAITSTISRFFGGDGSAGDLTVSASLDWEATPPSNPYFNNITIDTGQTLTVPAGTTIRCRGSFINNGTLFVAANTNGGSRTSSSVKAEALSAPHPGDSIRAAGAPASTFEFSIDTPFLAGGLGGSGIPQTRALSSYNHFQYGGGGGSGHRREGTDGNGGDGGGLVKIRCNGTITNNGLIDANASTTINGGGGGGGIVILASLTEVINGASATITANGGDGEAAGTDHGNAGGGGGGVIVMIAPSIPNLAGTTSVLGGSAASVSTPIPGMLSTGGGGGGASGGDGGNGGSLSSLANPSAGSNGSSGYVIQIVAIPLLY